MPPKEGLAYARARATGVDERDGIFLVDIGEALGTIPGFGIVGRVFGRNVFAGGLIVFAIGGLFSGFVFV